MAIFMIIWRTKCIIFQPFSMLYICIIKILFLITIIKMTILLHAEVIVCYEEVLLSIWCKEFTWSFCFAISRWLLEDHCKSGKLRANLVYWAETAKGQLNSEWIHEVIVSPKKSTKNYKDFCPNIQTRIVALFLVIFWWL